jgi:hypothetical protein
VVASRQPGKKCRSSIQWILLFSLSCKLQIQREIHRTIMKLHFAAILLLALASYVAALKPKMIGQPIEDSNRRLKDQIPSKAGSELSSHNAIFTGECSSGGTFSFKVGGGSGRGTVALMSSGATTTMLSFDGDCEACLADITGKAEPNVFGFQGEEVSHDGSAFPLEYKGIPSTGASLTMACDIDTDVLIILKDANIDGIEAVEAEVTWSPGNSGKTKQSIKTKNGKVAKKSLKAVAKQNKNKNGDKTASVSFSAGKNEAPSKT